MDTIEQEMKASQKFSDQILTDRLLSGALAERKDLGSVLVLLSEFDRRRLGPTKGYPSLFVYCTTVLGYSSAAAARRIAVARAGRRFPSLVAMVRRGELHLEGAAMLAPLLDSGNRRKLLRQARGRSLEEIAKIISIYAPQAAKRDHIRVVASSAELPPITPVPKPSDSEDDAPGFAPVASAADAGWDALFGLTTASPPSQSPAASTKEIFRVSFDADAETMEMLRRAQEILRHRFPKAELNLIVKSALDMLLNHEDRERKRVGNQPARPASKQVEGVGELKAAISASGRRIPESVKQTVYARDRGRCTWVGSDGMVCKTRAWLEFDHVRPAALGGPSGDPGNIRLLCREHNQLAARLIFAPQAFPEPVLTG